MSENVVLTGITGYIGEHVAAELLRAGLNVTGTVRSKAKTAATETALREIAPAGSLRFVEADLVSDEGWEAAMAGADYVIHVASPFYFAEPKDDAELVTPAVEGTRRVLSAAQRAGVKRTVLTSSGAAVFVGRGSGRFGPDDWSDINANIGAYAKSKTLAERAAWELVAAGPMELVVINPGAVFGPSLGAEAGGQSAAMMRDLIQGELPMIPDLTIGMIDVRDVAELHVRALLAAGVAGRRFIAASEEPVEMASLVNTLREAGYDKVPKRRAPTMLLRVISLFDRDLKGMLPMLGQRTEFDISDTVDLLNWKSPRPVEQAVLEMAEQISNRR